MDEQFDRYAAQLEQELRQQFPGTEWYVERSASAMIDAELRGLSWKDRQSHMVVRAACDGYATLFPAPYLTTVADLTDVAQTIGRVGERMLASYQKT